MLTSGPYNAGISLRGQTTASTSPPRVARQPHTQCPARRAGERPAAAGPRQLPHRALHDRRFPRSARARSGATRAAPRPRASTSGRRARWPEGQQAPGAVQAAPARAGALARALALAHQAGGAHPRHGRGVHARMVQLTQERWRAQRHAWLRPHPAGHHAARPAQARCTQAGEPPLTVRCSPTAQWLGVTLRRSKLCSHAETSADAAHTWGCISPQAHNESRHLCIVHCQWGAQTRRRPERRVCVHLVHARRCGADPAPHPRAPTAHSGLQTPGLAPLNAHRSEFFMDVDRQPRPTAGRHGRTCARWCAARARRSA